MRHYLPQAAFRPFIVVVLFLCFWWGHLFAHAEATKKIETAHFSLGFKESMTGTAQRVANTLETIYAPVSRTLGIYPRPIRIWFNSQTAYANGHLSMSPRHIALNNFHSADPYFVGNMDDWFSFLCIHEFRHAVQYSTQYHSIPFLLRPIYVLGNMIPYVGIPRFFSEGDAVGIETALSKSGRGRLPTWDKWYKIHLLEGKAASFGQQLFGSAHYRTDYYVLGYYLSTHIRRKYGAEAMKAIYAKSIRMPFVGFYNTIKSVTKKSLLKVYREMNEELLLGWQKQLEGLPITPVTQLTIKKPTDNFDYSNPFMDAAGNLLAWKSGPGVRMQLVVLRPYASAPTLGKNTISSFQEKRMLYCLSNELLPAACAVGEGCAAWLESCLHPWKGKPVTYKENHDHTYRVRLQYYDFKEKKRRTLVQNSRYNALAISPDSRQLVAVASDDRGDYHLAILDIKNGKVIKKIAHPEGGYYLTPSWCDAAHIVVTRTKDQQNSIIRIHVDTGNVETLLLPSYEHRNFPKIYKDYLLYNSSYNGIDNIYAMHLVTKACFQVTSRKYGAYLGMVDPVENKLIFSDSAKDGMNIVSMPFDPLLWLPLDKVVDRSLHYYAPLVTQEYEGDLLSKVPDHLYPVKPYCFGDGLSLTGIGSGNRQKLLKVKPVELVSLQNNFRLSPYLYYNIFNLNFIKHNSMVKSLWQDKIPGYRALIGAAGAKVSYQTCYPILDMDMGFRWYKGGSSLDGRRLALGITLPYYFSLDSSSGSLSLGSNFIFRPSNTSGKSIDWSQAYKCTIEHESTRSSKDIHAPWAQSISMKFKHRLTDPTVHQFVHKLHISGTFYFPGIGAHHYMGLQLEYYYDYSEEKGGKMCLNDNDIMIHQFPKHRLYPKLRYGLPLCYPEFGLPLIWFVKKVSLEGYVQHCSTTELHKGDRPSLVQHGTDRVSFHFPWKHWFNRIGIQCCIYQRFFSITDREPEPHILLDFAFNINKKGKWVFDPGICTRFSF